MDGDGEVSVAGNLPPVDAPEPGGQRRRRGEESGAQHLAHPGGVVTLLAAPVQVLRFRRILRSP